MNSRLVVGVLLVCLAVPVSAQLRVETTSNGLTASNCTPGGTVVLLGHWSIPKGTHVKLDRTAVAIVDDDRDGVVHYRLSVPERSTWIVADVAAGATTIAHVGRDWPVLPLGPESLGHNEHGRIAKIYHRAADMNLLVVRPGVGAWYVYASDETATDDQKGRRGRFSTRPDMLTPLGHGEPPPRQLERTDIILAVDPASLRTYTTVVTE